MAISRLHEDTAAERELGAAEFGPREVRMAPYAAIVPFRQIRTTIEAESLDELKNSIRGTDAEGDTTYNLVNAVVVADLDEANAREYVTDLNSLWGTDYQLDMLPFDPETGRYMFLVAGHRRWTAIGDIIREDGLNRTQARIAVSTQRNINFAQAIVLQMQENTYERPPATDQAEAIRLAYDFFRAREARLSKAGFARRIGRSPDVVSSALLYSDLPDGIKKWVKDKDISYTLAVTLGQIRSEYVKRFSRIRDEGLFADDDNFETAEAYADYEITTLAFSYRAMLQKHHRLTAKVYERAKEQLSTLRTQDRFIQDAFELVIQQESARRRRLRAVRGLGESSMRALKAALREDPDLLQALQSADPEAIEMLRSGLDRAKGSVPVRGDEQMTLLN